jgi:hypothetical protein
MKDPLKLKELILKDLDMARVMLDYKVKFSLNPMRVNEAQFKCPFHGKDNKPSARFYRDTQSCWCWVCQKSWDVVSFVMDKEQMYFKQAINFLVEKYKLDTSSISEDPELKFPTVVGVPEINTDMICLRRKIREFKGKLSFEKYKIICFAFYLITFHHRMGKNIVEDMEKLRTKLDLIEQMR